MSQGDADRFWWERIDGEKNVCRFSNNNCGKKIRKSRIVLI